MVSWPARRRCAQGVVVSRVMTWQEAWGVVGTRGDTQVLPFAAHTPFRTPTAPGAHRGPMIATIIAPSSCSASMPFCGYQHPAYSLPAPGLRGVRHRPAGGGPLRGPQVRGSVGGPVGAAGGQGCGPTTAARHAARYCIRGIIRAIHAAMHCHHRWLFGYTPGGVATRYWYRPRLSCIVVRHPKCYPNHVIASLCSRLCVLRPAAATALTDFTVRTGAFCTTILSYAV